MYKPLLPNKCQTINQNSKKLVALVTGTLTSPIKSCVNFSKKNLRKMKTT